MPDSFFTSSKPRKRKRSESSSAHAEAPGKSRKFLRKPTTLSQEGKKKTKVNGVHHVRKPRVDEELSDRTDEEDGVDDMDLRVNLDDEDPGASGEEDENETPAEKRLRLARLYLDSVKVDLGEFQKTHFLQSSSSCDFYFISVDGEFDAAEIDRELISTRLKQDVLDNSGKVHLFVADSVCDIYYTHAIPFRLLIDFYLLFLV